MYRTVEHWWNQSWGTMNRRDLWLLRDEEIPPGDDGAWAMKVRLGKDEGTFPYRTEARVREDITILLSDHGPWKRIEP